MNEALLTAKQAAALLGVSLQTLYAYASRGKLQSVPGPVGAGGSRAARERRYPEQQVRRLLAQSRARSGHGPTAGAALNWGPPVMASSITQITPAGPRYRGVLFSELLQGEASFEAACELLWQEKLQASAAAPSDAGFGIIPRGKIRELELGAFQRRVRHAAGAGPLPLLQLLVPWLQLGAPPEHGLAREHELESARALLGFMALGLGLLQPRPDLRRLLAEKSVAGRILVGLGPGRQPTAARKRLVNAALIASLDHELNASTFAARVAASTGAGLHSAMSAALGALSGPRHGRACDRVEAMLEEIGEPKRAVREIHERAARGESLPGFGHPLYPAGDPRGSWLIGLAAESGKPPRGLRALLALAEAMPQSGREPATLDAGLVAVALALELPRGSAAGLFALGRAGGWVAHIQEQRARPELLRPRAQYVAPSPSLAGESSS